MYLHVGQNTVIKTKDIVGIFDLDTSTIKKTTRDYLYTAEKSGKVRNVSEDLPKSFIITDRGGEKSIFISPISTATLTKRNKNFM